MRRPSYTVLTFLFGNYEKLHEVEDVQPNVEYLCITDNKNLRSSTWKVIYDEVDPSFTPFRKVIETRYNPFKYASAEVCLIIDGSISLKRFPWQLMNKFKHEEYELAALSHPERCLLDDELEAWKKLRNFSTLNVLAAQKFLENISYDKSCKGLYQVGVLCARNCEKYRSFCSKCLNVLRNLTLDGDSFRVDQVFFSAVLHKFFQDMKFLLISDKELRGKYFRIHPHGMNQEIQEVEINLSNKQEKYSFDRLQESLFIDNCKTEKRDVTIGICNFNTTKLTNACLKSILKNGNCHRISEIVVLDNSDSEEFILEQDLRDKVKVLNNTNGQLIDFKKVVQDFGGYSINNHANLKHTFSIQFLLDCCRTDFFVLFDSDVLLKHSIDFLDDSICTCGELQPEYTTDADTRGIGFVRRKERLTPFIQMFNIKMLRDSNAKYFHPVNIVGSKNQLKGAEYDTGGSFFEDLKSRRLPYATLKNSTYIEHCLGSSWAKINDQERFLRQFEHLYK